MSKWSYDGTELDSIGIVTLVADSLGIPARRGENMLVPFRPGRVFVAKEFEQRAMTLGLEVHGDTRAELETAVDAVKQLLSRRLLKTLSQTLEDLTVRTAQAELVGDLGVSPVSPVSVRMVLNFVLPDPFFYGTTQVSESVTVDASPKTLAVTNPGTVEARDPTIVLTGPLENTEITNPENGASIKYNAAIAAPRVVTISKDANGEYVATTDLGANVIGNVTHSGGAFLFALEKKITQNLSITDDVATTGQVAISFYPPYL